MYMTLVNCSHNAIISWPFIITAADC